MPTSAATNGALSFRRIRRTSSAKRRPKLGFVLSDNLSADAKLFLGRVFFHRCSMITDETKAIMPSVIWIQPGSNLPMPNGSRWNTKRTRNPAVKLTVTLPARKAQSCSNGLSRAKSKGTNPIRVGSKLTVIASSKTVIHICCSFRRGLLDCANGSASRALGRTRFDQVSRDQNALARRRHPACRLSRPEHTCGL